MSTTAETQDQVEVKLPDGSTRQVPRGATLLDLAKEIGPGLAKAALGGKINDQLVDLSTPITAPADVQLVTWKDEEGREMFRHTSTHIMAQALKRILPDAKLTVGPPLADSYYYDFDVKEPLTPEILEKIEAEMTKIVEEGLELTRMEVPREEAIRLFQERNEPYKLEIIEGLPDESTISLYKQGEFVDLCRGPHIPNTSYVKALKLLTVSGCYWRADAKNQVLQRVYGTSFPDKKQLAEHLRILEEAKKRDHRRIGKDLDLFSFQDEGPGFPFFHPNGMVIYNEITNFIREELTKRDYVEIMTPIILNDELWHKSGHFEHYKENMYFTEVDEQDFAVKPMNCPGCCLVYRNSLHSYRDLPLKMAEFGRVHRHELSGALHGLFRVRSFTQDDAHIFCTPDQLEAAVTEAIELIQTVYEVFGFTDYHMELSTRPEKSLGSDEMWENATVALQNSLERLGVQFKLNPGDGAFYGPKIDFHVKDCLNRTWQCATIQVDFSMPERFDLNYVGPDGQKHRPVMVHRAVVGSLERFIGVLTEHTAGNFPTWLAPVQTIVLPVSEKSLAYGEQVLAELKGLGFRAELDSSEDKISAKIRNAELRKIPYMLVIGEKEAAAGTVGVRRHGKGDQGARDRKEFMEELQQEVRERRRD